MKTTPFALLIASFMLVQLIGNGGFASATHAANVTFDWATVGNSNNVADNTGFGAVASIYRISKTEVTNAQYTDFLNSVAETDTHSLYNNLMSVSSKGGILQGGSSGNYSYTVKPGRDNNPVNFLTFWSAVRFTNWLNNGQPVGSQDNTTTEDGAYTLGGVTNPVPSTVSRNAGATRFIPSEDEWYKAAYYGQSGIYRDYPMGSIHHPPYSDNPNSVNTPNFAAANFFNDDRIGNGYNSGFAVTGSPVFDFFQNYLTDVGAYTRSPSEYGTFDQGGNVWEWTESAGVLRGGSYISRPNTFDLASTGRRLDAPFTGSDTYGFRVASIPEPSSLLLGALAVMGLLMRRRRFGRRPSSILA